MTPCLPHSTRESELHKGTRCRRYSSLCTSKQPFGRCADVSHADHRPTKTYPARQYMQTTSTLSQQTTSPCAKSTRSRLQHWATGSCVVNVEKTELTIISRETDSVAEQWRTTKKLGSLLGDVEDLSRRKMLAVTAFRFTWSLCGLFHVVSGSKTEKQDAFHRKQLSSLVGVHWPQRISNVKLYKRCRCRQIRTYVMDMRWRPHSVLG